jgi:hypothetical protein
MSGPDVGELLVALGREGGSGVVDRAALVPLPARMDALRAWLSSNSNGSSNGSAAAAAASSTTSEAATVASAATGS